MGADSSMVKVVGAKHVAAPNPPVKITGGRAAPAAQPASVEPHCPAVVGLRAHNAVLMPNATASRGALFAAFAAVYLIWGSTYLVMKFAVATMPPLLMAGTRYGLAGGLLYGFMRWRGEPAPTLRGWCYGAFIGVCLLGFGNGGTRGRDNGTKFQALPGPPWHNALSRAQSRPRCPSPRMPRPRWRPACLRRAFATS